MLDNGHDLIVVLSAAKYQYCSISESLEKLMALVFKQFMSLLSSLKLLPGTTRTDTTVNDVPT